MPKIVGPYAFMPVSKTYASGVQALRDSYAAGECPSQPTVMIDDKTVVRPLTLKENLQARVEDFETLCDENSKERSLQDRLGLFSTRLDSSTGIAYEEGTTRFKIIPACRELITIDPHFYNKYIPVSYDDVHGDNVVTLDRHDGIYDKELTREQVMNHPAWRVVVGDDEDGRRFLDVYSQVVFNYLTVVNVRLLHHGYNEGMGFYTIQRPKKEGLRALFVSAHDQGSLVSGYYRLFNDSLFLRVSH